jgi:hypothetical protein
MSVEHHPSKTQVRSNVVISVKSGSAHGLRNEMHIRLE